eukprot:CAMPEP_0170462544 /NCGR_PEP_ID=MMETSP0123-20130129/8014_1 /TAXON_ID=182087 /ORGANISM="Favella ehrenbergii, Strain Fehren 1" /LENGTH=53 /DNA_ID=CAMNT_0010727799 /DNA_START=1308 /DNA_END=1469 /DNA_ORIENTATION=-
MAAATAENIRDTFNALHMTTYELQGGEGNNSGQGDEARLFYQTTKEVFSKYAH